MTEEQLTALQASIEHWEENRRLFLSLANSGKKIGEEEAPIYSEDCACCDIAAGFFGVGKVMFCLGCPISEYTGHDDCGGTPWRRVWDALRQGHMELAAMQAKKMVQWMEDLRDGKEPGLVYSNKQENANHG